MTEERGSHAVAIVGMSAIMPEAPCGATFWRNITEGRYCIGDVPRDRWDPDLYYDPDPTAVDRTYSRIGGWVRAFDWDPLGWRLPIPPKVAEQMDVGQQWAINLTRAALADAGWAKRPADPERVAVIVGNAIGGEKHYATSLKIQFAEVAAEFRRSSTFATLDEDVRAAILAEAHAALSSRTPPITEDTMPGELANCIAGRIANLFDFRGPNFTTDAACASALAAMTSAIEGLAHHQYDVAISGGIDRNMGVAAFVKFCRIGALSATGTRPYADGADGFVMGEGGALFVLKRLADAERDGDRIYAVVRGIAGSSDGKGKGITAPNPAGQRLAVQRAWQNAGLDPRSATLVEGHGTSTRVGDVVEVEALQAAFGGSGLAPGSIALGSVKSNIGHLKAAAGAAGLFKTAMAISERVLPPSINASVPNPHLDWSRSPFRVNGELRDWQVAAGSVRTAGVSAFGFGGTNFHAVLEEYVPGRVPSEAARRVWSADVPTTSGSATAGSTPAGTAGGRGAEQAAPSGPPAEPMTSAVGRRAPLRGALVLGGDSTAAVGAQLDTVARTAAAGDAPDPAPPEARLASAPVRLAIDYGDAAELAEKAAKAQKALATDNPAMWKMLRAQGVFLGRGPAAPVAFLYTGQGSQYVNMLADLRAAEPIVARTFEEADEVMTPLLGRPLSDHIFIDADDPAAVRQLEQQLLQTEITQPAVLAVDTALTRLLAAYGIRPDMVMGHSLGEYGALVAAGALTFAAALEAVSARGREMAGLAVEDNGAMAAVFAPLEEVQRIVDAADGYVVLANVNSTNQAVIGGATAAVEAAMARLQEAGGTAVRLPVSHAFHTSIVAPASVPLRETLVRLDLRPPVLPIVANVHGGFYPSTGDVKEAMLDLLARQVASPVQFVDGLHTLYDAGARLFVELGPKKALFGFVEDVLGSVHDDVAALFTNHPKQGGVASFNQALCGLYAAGHGFVPDAAAVEGPAVAAVPAATAAPSATVATVGPTAVSSPVPIPTPAPAPRPTAGDPMSTDHYTELGRLFAEMLDRGRRIHEGARPAPSRGSGPDPLADEPIVITGAALGLPGVEKVFDDRNLARLLAGESLIDLIPLRLRQLMADKHITRLVKRDVGDPTFETIDSTADVIKLAGRFADFDVAEEFGVEPARAPALDRTEALAIGAGYDALRDAGIPLTMHYKATTLGTKLPDRWGLPAQLRDETGVVFASAFPGYDAFGSDLQRYYEDRARREQLEVLVDVRGRLRGDEPVVTELDRRIAELRSAIEHDGFLFDRRFLFKALSMGHAQFAELVGARGPNTQVNAACASTTQALAIAEDWIRAGRCRRVVVIAADDVTSSQLLPWAGSGFLSSGAAATDDDVASAALPFDARRHGMIMGAGAAALVVEAASAARERGLQPICELVSTVTANSAFHGTRLDVSHIEQVMETLLRQAEARGVDRHAIAARTAFVSHETYTPARGGSASAEISALRHVFGPDADDVVITNTKGFTGHAMGAGIEDVVAVKLLETGIVPPVANFKEVDPELGELNLSRGGSYPVDHALRLAAGFGSQISMALLRWTPTPDRARRLPTELGFEGRVVDQRAWEHWLSEVSGHRDVELEVDRRRLRVVDQGPPAFATAAPVAATAAPGLAPDMPVPAASAGPLPSTPAEPVAAAQPAPAAPHSPAVPAPAPAAPPAAPAPAPDPVTERVLAIVAGMTGYPSDLLDLDLDLEADLGVDTVKQAEVFAAVREEFVIEREEDLRLRDFPTLAHVIGFVRDRATGLPPAPATVPTVPTVPSERQDPQSRVPTPVAPGPGKELEQGDPVADAVLEIVAEMTGYPSDLLDLDLDLEADLGVDTVKQAEVFAAVRERFVIERDEDLRLRDFPTLSHVIGFVHDRGTVLPTQTGIEVERLPSAGVTGAAPTPDAPRDVEGTAAPTSVDDPVTAAVLDVVAEMTGYPPELLELDLDLEADLGVDTVKQAEVFAAVRERYGIERDENLQLRDFPTLADVIGFVRDRAPALAGADTATAGMPGEAATSATSDDDPVTAVVLDVVAEMTGYPPELLELDLDLEADLGVDTVKQAEVFAAVRERYGIERDENLQLRDFPTLADVIGFVRDRAPGLAAAETPAEAAPAEAAPAGEAPAGEGPTGTAPTAGHRDDEEARSDGVAPGELEATDRIPRRVPVPVLRPELERCRPTGVELGDGTRVVVMADRGGVARSLTSRLDKLGVRPLVLEAGVATDALLEQLEGWLADGAIDGVYWLAALDEEEPLVDLTLDGWREALRIRVKNLYTAMRRLVQAEQEVAPFLVSASRLGGYHGYDEAGAVAPMGGAVTGFTKAYKREQPDTLVKAVDLPRSRKTAALADLLLEETLRDPGVVEVGRADGRRWTVGLREEPFGDGTGGLELDSDTVVLVTGAAGSIVSAITADLARASGGTFHLLDLVAEPDADDADLHRFTSDRDGLKADLAARLRDQGERPTPVRIERALARFERLEAAQAAIRAVTDGGGEVHYHQVDLTSPDAVAAVVEDVRRRHGRIDVLLHAAGLEISRGLTDKEPREYDLVFDVKSDGWFNLLSAAGDLPIGATIGFSSIAGRFGNAGQTDYSAANDLLCKYASSFRTARPGTRGIALDWTAWGGIGMATRGSIPKIMEMAGIELLPPETGIAWIRRELTAGSSRGEVVVAGALGVLTDEWDETGGVDPAAFDVGDAGPMVGEVLGFDLVRGLVVETTLDPGEQPFLHDHRIEGTPVLPGVMGIEAFAEVTRLLVPDRRVTAVEDVSFLAPFKFFRDEPRTLTVSARVRRDGDDLVADCRLEGVRALANQDAPQRTTHFTGSVRLSSRASERERAALPAEEETPHADPDAIYRVYFHGPAYQVLARAWRSDGGPAGRLASDLPPDHQPAEDRTVMAPRLVELCFQTSGIWEIGRSGRLALPRHVGRVEVLADPGEARLPLVAVATPVEDGFDCRVVDAAGDVVVRLEGYGTVVLPGGVDDEARGPLERAMG
jgi:acyl transferase domain-containing protein/acyl carrier protein